MDDKQLKKILEADTILSDENAKKRLLNIALAEFDSVQKKNKETPQGFSFPARLISSSNQKVRKTAMNKKHIFGGAATALALVLIAGISVEQFMSKTPLSESLVQKDVSMIAGAPKGERQELAMNEMAASPAPAMATADSSVASSRAMMKMGGLTEGAMPMAPGGAVMGYAGDAVQPVYQDIGRDKFEDFDENTVKAVVQEPVSTFSIDVDTSSYSFVRRQLNNGVLPQKDAVRVEEMVNYFDYNYPVPATRDQPFQPSIAIIDSPWKEGNKIIRIGVKGYDIAPAEQPKSNLVFLLDTSGSMSSPDKLPLVIQSLKMMLDTLKSDDTISIVTYAGSAGTALEPTKVSDKAKIIAALDNLFAGGSTAGAEGIRQAYTLAEASFNKDAVNRVILATDGDFNVGITNPEELKDFIERKRDSGVYLSVLGFGQGNLNDQMMQELAQNGNGTAAYIDTLNEARKVLVKEASSTLFPIAKDVKIQVEFNPATVSEYRLVGYETRALNKEDFNNDKVDAGDIGAGHAVTALYEITPVGGAKTVDDNRYAQATTAKKPDSNFGDEYAFLKIRYKLPKDDTSKLITTPVTQAAAKPSEDANWAVAVAGFGQLLKGGKNTGALTYDDVIALAQANKGTDEYGYRAEFINLVRAAQTAAALPQQ